MMPFDLYMFILTFCIVSILFSIFLMIRIWWVYRKYRAYNFAIQVYFLLLASKVKTLEEAKNLPSEEELDYVFQKVLWPFNKMVWNIGVWNVEQMVYDLEKYRKIMEYKDYIIG